MSTDHEPISVEVSDTQAHVRVDPDRLASIVRRVLQLQGVARAAISLAIVDDAAIRRVHADHLDDDTPTDVITFDLSEPESAFLAGEVILSSETAARVAEAEGIPPANELILYLVHALLHLSGHDDRDQPSRTAMRRREAEVMAALELDHPGA